MEQSESIKESVVREYREETALKLQDPKLAGAFTFTILKNNSIVHEWMMFTFVCNTYEGSLTEHCEEGELEWVAFDQLNSLPMAEGDRKIFDHVLTSSRVLYGTFLYTDDYELIDLRLDPS